jgi:photosystem II stability/assembly factor-like uncharacterized protein
MSPPLRPFAAFALCLALQTPPPPEWLPQTSGVTARLRGVSAVTDTTAWASGTSGTVLRTTDGGATWRRVRVPGADALDFRDVDAIDARTAFVLSIGPGDSSRIYKTSDGGETWDERFVNPDPKGFFDAMAFWDAMRGVAFSDSVDGRFVIVTTGDGGRTWRRVPDRSLPAALPNEGAFAASGTNVTVYGSRDVWIGTGAAATARELRSRDGGLSWSVAPTPLPAGPSAGIFSVAFRSATHGIVVGGDYAKEREAVDNAAMTTDGGATWTLVTGLAGYRSAVSYVPSSTESALALIAVGPTGADYSVDDGRTWMPTRAVTGLHAISVARAGRTGWGVGEDGTIARLKW